MYDCDKLHNGEILIICARDKEEKFYNTAAAAAAAAVVGAVTGCYSYQI